MKTMRNELGTTLVATLILLFALFALTAAGLIASTSSMQISGNYRTGTQALLLAETGIVHSVQKLNELAIRRLDNEAVSAWETVFGSGVKSLSGYDGYEYSVTAASVAANPLSRMEVTATGEAPPASLRRIEAILKLDGAFSPGAIYMPGSTVNTDFDGNKFLIDGRDHIIQNTIPPYAETEDRPGIALKSESNVTPVMSSLNSGQWDNVEGLGGAPSVLPAVGPSSSRIENDIANAILATPGVVTNPLVHGNDTFGTISPVLVPQITHFTGDVTLNGTVNGAGILIVDGGLTVSGDLNFVGLIIVRGSTTFTKKADETAVIGDSAIIGAIWTTNLNLTVAGSASVTYSSQALEMMNAAFGGNLLPQDVAVAAWKEA